jgi:hypothetical protein
MIFTILYHFILIMMSRLFTLSTSFLFFVCLISISFSDKSIAQSTTRTTDITPKYPSICNLNKNSPELHHGKPIGIINQRGEVVVVVADINYTNNFRTLLGDVSGNKVETPVYFSLWSQRSIVLSSRSTPHAMQKIYIQVDNQRIPVEFASVTDHKCVYGNIEFYADNGHWRRHNIIEPNNTVRIMLSPEAQEVLRLTTKNSKVSIIYQGEGSNKLYETEFNIGDGTIQAWRKIDKFYRQISEKNKPVETPAEESPENKTDPPINNEE